MNKKLISTKMKIFLLVMFILSVIFYASGCIILIQSNYNLSDYSYEFNIHPSSLRYNLDFTNNFLNFTNSYSSHDYELDNNISELDFNLNSQNIEVINNNNSILNIKIKSFSSSNTELNLVNSNNKMTFSPTVDIPSSADIIVSMPSYLSSKVTLKITTSSGDITINNLSTNTLNASSASGDINLRSTNLNYLYLSSSSGNMNISSSTTSNETNLTALSGSINGNGNFGALTGSTSSGDIKLTFKDNLNNTFLSSMSGDVNLHIPSFCGYEANFNTISGSLNNSENNMTNGDKSSKINVNTTSGDFDLQVK